jgi:hypothetical protein
LDNPVINRILCVKNTSLAKEADIYYLIRNKTGISIQGIYKNEAVCYVLFKSVDFCEKAFGLLQDKKLELVLNNRYIYFDRFKFNNAYFLFRHMDDSFNLDELQKEKHWYEHQYYEIKKEVEKLSEKKLELESELKELKKALKEHTKSKRKMESIAKKERMKEFEILRKKCIQQLKNFKI